MSGLCGVVHFDGALADPEIVAQMAMAASHRGPDGTRFWSNDGVGFAHLVHHITPESRCEQQPLISEHGRFVLNADARIDNREELIRTLQAKEYLTEPNPTDADLILAAYRCWDTDCPSHLIGDFAFAIWDRLKQRLFAARDVMGMRAFYYRVEPKRTLFATEVKQLLTVPDVRVRIFEPAVGAHLAGPFGRPEWTFYDGIAQLPPAYGLVVTADGHRTWRYWDIDPDWSIQYTNEDEYAQHFCEIFQEAVRCRLRSIKPVGISLSGGMDSGSAASMAGWLWQHNRLGNPHPIHAYCWAFEDLTSCDERHISDGIVRHYDLPVTYVPADAAWPLKDYPAHGPDRDDPFIWPYQALIEHTLAAAQSDGIGLMMTGDRGDEMVGDWVFDHPGLLRTGQWQALWAELQAHSRRNRVSLSTVVKRFLVRPLFLSLWPHKTPHGRRRFERSQQGHIASLYPDWVRPEFAKKIGLEDIVRDNTPQTNMTDFVRRQRYQRIFMFAGTRIALLNERNQAQFGLAFADPWSDQRIARFVLSVPQWVIQQVREPKRIARRAMRGIMPEPVRQTVRKIEPHALFNRGFMDQSKATVQRLITRTQAGACGYLDESVLRDCYASFLRGEPPCYDFWWPLTLEMWLRRYFP